MTSTSSSSGYSPGAICRDLVDGVRSGIGMVVGFTEGLLNVATSELPMPFTEGDVLEPRGAAETAGSNAARALLHAVGLLHERPRTWTDPHQEPLLATTTIDVSKGQDAHVSFRATPSAKNDWKDADRASSVVGVYVDGRYQSDIEVPTERNEPYDVNLGALRPGTHAVELRDASDVAPKDAAPPAVSGVTTHVTTGEQALIDRNEPLVETRDVGTNHGAPSFTYDDAPLLMTPFVDRHPDGSQTIRYSTLFSNEDDGTPYPELYTRWGRSTDWEGLYWVDVDKSGKVTGRGYEGERNHQHYSFQGALVHGRAEIRVANDDNQASEHLDGQTPIWSPGLAPEGDTTSASAVMLQHPWTFAVSAKEMARENPGADPASYVFFDGTMANEAAAPDTKTMTLQLHDGSTCTVSFGTELHEDASGEGAKLPAGVTASDVVGVVGATQPVGLFVLDGGSRPRMLTGPTR